MKLIAIRIDGRLTIHAPGVAGYETLCGTDSNDPKLGLCEAALPPRAKINCEQCLAVYRAARTLSPKLFAVDIYRKA